MKLRVWGSGSVGNPQPKPRLLEVALRFKRRHHRERDKSTLLAAEKQAHTLNPTSRTAPEPCPHQGLRFFVEASPWYPVVAECLPGFLLTEHTTEPTLQSGPQTPCFQNSNVRSPANETLQLASKAWGSSLWRSGHSHRGRSVAVLLVSGRLRFPGWGVFLSDCSGLVSGFCLSDLAFLCAVVRVCKL